MSCGIVLQIAVHGDDVLARGMVKSGRQCRSLPKIATQFYHDHPAIHGSNLLQHVKSVVAAAVVDENQLERLTGGLHDHPQTVVELGNVFFLVMEGHDYGIFGHGLTIIPIWDSVPGNG